VPLPYKGKNRSGGEEGVGQKIGNDTKIYLFDYSELSKITG
jgi:hypothetical protein